VCASQNLIYAGNTSFFPFMTEIKKVLNLKLNKYLNQKFTFSYIQIEEIAVQNCLNNACNDSNQVVMALNSISIDLWKKLVNFYQ
jgi:hypothetical protein